MYNPINEYHLIVHWLAKFVGHEITPKKFVHQLGIFLNRRHPVRVKLDYNNVLLDAEDFTIGGIYESEHDRQRKKPFTLYFIVNHDKNQPWLITTQLAADIAIELVESISHERRHQYQYRSRKFMLSRAYKSFATDPHLRAEQEYLGCGDEIDAYAYNIAVRNALGVGPSRDLMIYERAFGRDHPVVRRLHKKILKSQNNLRLRKSKR